MSDMEKLFNEYSQAGGSITDYMPFRPAELTEQSLSSLTILLHMLYRLHGSEAWYSWMMGGLDHLGAVTLRRLQGSAENPIEESEKEALRATLIMCRKGLWDQGRLNAVQLARSVW